MNPEKSLEMLDQLKFEIENDKVLAETQREALELFIESLKLFIIERL